MGAKRGSSTMGKIKKAAGAIAGKIKPSKSKGKGKGAGTKHRRHGVVWWSNRVLIEKLKKRYFKLKYGGR